MNLRSAQDWNFLAPSRQGTAAVLASNRRPQGWCVDLVPPSEPTLASRKVELCQAGQGCCLLIVPCGPHVRCNKLKCTSFQLPCVMRCAGRVAPALASPNAQNG